MKLKTLIILLLLGNVFLNSGLANTYYVSHSGDDNNSGTITSRFKTIQKAADMAMPGDTVYVFEGIYRERVAPPRGGTEGNEIVYRGEPGKNVIIKGSDIWSPDWEKESGNIYYAVPNEAMFNDDCYVDDKNPFKVAVSSTPYGLDGKPEVERGYGGDPNLILSIGQVFVDGKLYTQKGYLSQTVSTPESWYYNRTSGAIYIHFSDTDPASHVIEISTRRRIFAPHLRGLGYLVVEGFIMEHCGNQYPTNFWESEHSEWQQAGALGTRSGHHWVIKNNMIRFAHGVGIDFGNEGNMDVDLESGFNGKATGSGYHIIDSNYITDNGSGGTAAYYPSNITFTKNVVERNNNLRFVGKKRWESAGVKMHGPHYSIISNNLIRNNYGKWGLWLDQGSGNGTQVHGNLLVGNEVGFDLEIGTAYQNKLILDNNIFINNKTAIASRESGGITAMNNLIIGSSDYGIHNTITKTRTGSWSSENHHYFNNILLNNQVHLDVYPPDFYRSADRQFDYNIYDAKAAEKKFEVYGLTPGSFDFSAWQDIWNSYNSGQNYDLNSLINESMTYQFDSISLDMTFNIGFDINDRKTKPHSSLDNDYLGNIIPTDDTTIPGPFQNLKQGQNQFSLWDGLRPLAEYELPYDDINTSLKESFLSEKQLKNTQAVSLAKPSAVQYKWHEQERLMFLHFAPTTWSEVEQNDYSVPLSRINPQKLNTDQWCEAALAFGAKQIIYVAKHTGGFCWWQTETTDYGIRNTPYKNGKGDVLKELSESCKKYGLNLGVYVYPGDLTWGAMIGSGGITNDPNKQEAYNEVFRKQLIEVLTNYGEMLEVWFDGSCKIDVSDILEKHAKNAVIFQGPHASLRWPGTESGKLFYPAWNSVKREDLETGVSTQIHGTTDGDAWAPLETNTTLYNQYWFWSPNKVKKRKSLQELMDCYYQSVGYGSVFLLNALPDTTGLIPEGDMKRYREFGNEIKRRFEEPIAEIKAQKNKIVFLKFDKPTLINHTILMEDYQVGERIREYKIEGFSEGKWVEITKGISVGRKKIDYFKDIEVEQIKLMVNKAAAEPIIRSFSAYYVSNFKTPVKQSLRVRARPEIISSWKRSDLKNNRIELKVQLDDKIRVPGQYALSLIPDIDQKIEVKSASLFYNGNKAMKEFVTIKGNTILINQTAQITEDSELSIIINLHLNETCDGKIEFVPRLIH